jgi:hypothetical protein
MIPTMNMLTRSQRFGYVLSLLLLSAGWLFLLAFILEWRAAHWSRPALALQAAALVVALLLRLEISICGIPHCHHPAFPLDGRGWSSQAWCCLAY